jgi:hypothetical protein
LTFCMTSVGAVVSTAMVPPRPQTVRRPAGPGTPLCPQCTPRAVGGQCISQTATAQRGVSAGCRTSFRRLPLLAAPLRPPCRVPPRPPPLPAAGRGRPLPLCGTDPSPGQVGYVALRGVCKQMKMLPARAVKRWFPQVKRLPGPPLLSRNKRASLGTGHAVPGPRSSGFSGPASGRPAARPHSSRNPRL